MPARPDTDLSRYHRQMLLPGFGPDGQARLGRTTAVIVGCGALGSVVADALARAGVGHLRLVDRDFLEITNLQRQVLYDEGDLAAGLPKAEAARRRLENVNSGIDLTVIVDDVNAASIERIAAGADLLVDGLDNFETRYLLNDYAVKHGIPYVYGGAVGTAGMAYAILPHSRDGALAWESLPGGSRATPCLRCLYPELPPPGETATCDTAGVLGPLVGLVASFQAAEALKIASANYAQVCPTLFNVDLWANTALHLKVADAVETSDCRCCRHREFDFLEGRAGSSADVLCGRDAVQLLHRQRPDALNLAELEQRLRPLAAVTVNEFLLRAELEAGGRHYQLTLFADGRAIVKGTSDPAVARSVYARLVGH